MVSDRALDPSGLGAIAAATGLIAAAAVIIWVLRHDFYGTMLFGSLLAIWLTTLLWWSASEPRDGAAVATVERNEEHEDERVMLRMLLDHPASIFLPFFTTEAVGNGIGLAAARQKAHRHGGDVRLRTTLPTTFGLSVPL